MGDRDLGRARFAAVRSRYVALIAATLLVSGLTVDWALRDEAASDPVTVAGGDICRTPTDCAPTAALIDQINPDRVRTGDAHEDGTLAHSAARATAPPYRFLYNSDSAPATVASYGWNLIDVGSQWSADQLHAGSKGLVWVGDYDNGSCDWEMSNASLRKEVSAAARDAKVFGYFISDEPNPHACPNAPAQHKARSDLIHSIDPTKPTVIVLDSNGFKGLFTRDALDQLPLWKGTADYIGLDPYPCRQGAACDFSWIDKTIKAANAAGLNYWGVVQAFNDSSWRWPTAGELSHMLRQWGASKETGYMTFAWTWDGNNLSSKSTLLAIFRQFNAGAASRRCVVPKVLGLTLARARVAIARANCLDGKVSKRYSSRRPGHVIAQHPKPGRRLVGGGRVSLVISKGHQR